MSPLAQKVQYIGDQIDGLSLRERVLVFISVTAVVYVLWQFFLYDTVIASTKKISEETSQLNHQLAAVNKEAELMQKILTVNPDESNKNKLKKLSQVLIDQEHKIHNLSSPFIRPDKLSMVLESIVKQNAQLQLISLQTMPPEPLAADNEKFLATGNEKPLATDNKKANKEDVLAEGLFKHSVRLHLRGGYKQAYDYLAALEKLPWHFYWQNMEYIVSSYPKADVFLEVYTISTGKGVFGV